MRRPAPRTVATGVLAAIAAGTVAMLLAKRRSETLHPHPTPPRRRAF
jgi:hypothetical protein